MTILSLKQGEEFTLVDPYFGSSILTAPIYVLRARVKEPEASKTFDVNTT
jgi:hypothetical protein